MSEFGHAILWDKSKPSLQGTQNGARISNTKEDQSCVVAITMHVSDAF